MRVIGSLTVNLYKLIFKFIVYITYYRLIEEFMLLANILVAQHLKTHFPTTAMLRNHHPPDSAPMEKATNTLKVYGINIDTTSAGSIHKSKAQYCQGENCHRDIIINNILSKPMVVSKNNKIIFLNF